MNIHKQPPKFLNEPGKARDKNMETEIITSIGPEFESYFSRVILNKS